MRRVCWETEMVGLMAALSWTEILAVIGIVAGSVTIITSGVCVFFYLTARWWDPPRPRMTIRKGRDDG